MSIEEQAGAPKQLTIEKIAKAAGEISMERLSREDYKQAVVDLNRFYALAALLLRDASQTAQ